MPGPSLLLGCGCAPGVAASLLGVALEEITDSRIGGADLWGAGIARRLDEQLQDCPEGQRSVLLREHLVGRLDRPRRFTSAVVDAVAHGIPIRELARDLALSERQLQRLSQREFGYGLTRLRAILRLQRVMAAAVRRPDWSVADLAAHCGYADQAHLARDCASIAGRTPTQLLASAAPHWHGEGSVVGMSHSSKPGDRCPA